MKVAALMSQRVDGTERGRRIRAGLRARASRLDPRTAVRRRFDGEGFLPRPASILGSDCPALVHVANFASNAGDVVLPVVLRDLFVRELGPIRWLPQHAHRPVREATVRRMNASSGTVIGGGGLFLRDTNPHSQSGWQWECSVDALNQIKTGLAVFAVGYNQFRGQEAFSDTFDRHVALLVEKAVFVGLRNSGSLRALGAHLPGDLGSRLTFQPCMTSVSGYVYPNMSSSQESADRGFVALNCAFDRAQKRFGADEDRILGEVAQAMKQLRPMIEVRYFAHTAEDEWMVPYFRRIGLDVPVVRLYRMSASEVLRRYAEASVVVGMRGHSQMIPFGLGVPIVSLVSHDKLSYFLEDVRMQERGLELGMLGLDGAIVDAVEATLRDLADARRAVSCAREELWQITRKNVRSIGLAMEVMA